MGDPHVVRALCTNETLKDVSFSAIKSTLTFSPPLSAKVVQKGSGTMTGRITFVVGGKTLAAQINGGSYTCTGGTCQTNAQLMSLGREDSIECLYKATLTTNSKKPTALTVTMTDLLISS